MTIKQRKLIVHFLKQLEKEFLKNRNQKLSVFFTHFFNREELIEILEHSCFDQDLKQQNIKTLENEQLLELIGEDYFILSFLIHKIESEITSVPKMTKEEVNNFFDKILFSAHYLRDKPIEEWDEYDVSNYYSLLFKHGKTKRVFAIFTADVKDEDKYAVTTKPSFFFDTKEEAEEELERVCIETKRSQSDFVIHTLWKIN